MNINISELQTVGYTFLIKELNLKTIPNWRTSYISNTATRHSIQSHHKTQEIYPYTYWPGDNYADHLEFAVKYDGINLSILYLIFDRIKLNELETYIKSKPFSKYARKIWFLYEFLTGRILNISPLTKGNYTEILEENRYYAISNGARIRRQRVINNLPGPSSFCPVIRKTELLKSREEIDIYQKSKEIIDNFPKDIIKRSLNYLYGKETKSSFEIENISPDIRRSEKFTQLLQSAKDRDYCNKKDLILLQNQIVDPRFKADNYRTLQNYVGETVMFQKEVIHFICPKPTDIKQLMEGLIESHNIMKSGGIPPVIHAAIISYGFVFLHPFEDGNGRIHRFLLHNILSEYNLIPHNLIFPVSATMLKHNSQYNESLEHFSKPISNVTDYSLDEFGVMEVLNNTSQWYQYMDLTYQAESLYEFITLTIEEELHSELIFITNYDKTRKSIQDIADLPDRHIDLFIKFCLQNSGRLSASKRKSYFTFLKDDELTLMEQIVQANFF